MDTESLQSANYDIVESAFYGTFAFVPVIDGMLILERPTVTLSRGQVNGVRDNLCFIFRYLTFPKEVLLAVTNQNEGNIFVDANETLKITDYISQLFPDMTHFEVEAAAAVYADYGTAVEQAIMVMGDCESHLEATGTMATLMGLHSHLCVSDVLPTADVRRSCMEGPSFEPLKASPKFDTS